MSGRCCRFAYQFKLELAVAVALVGASTSGVKASGRHTPASIARSEPIMAAAVRASAKQGPAASGEGGVSSAQLGGANDFCSNAFAISGLGTFQFDNVNATQDGPEHQLCAVDFGEPQIARDVWYCWTAPTEPCSDTTVISTCGTTTVDTKIAVYEGCACPPSDLNILACRDDDCSTQTRVAFTPTPGQSYLIRLGVFPGRAGGIATFTIACQDPLPCEEPAANCQIRDSADALNSDRTHFLVADDFTPAVSGQLTEFCFWGTYLDSAGLNCAGIAADSFEVRYFEDNGGRPGALLASFSQASAGLTVQGPAATGGFIDQNLPEYEFRVTHAPVNVSAGECYWVEVSNQTSGCSWFWEVAFPRDQRAMQDGEGDPTPAPPDGYDANDLTIHDLAFCTGLPLADVQACVPPPPANDSCAGSISLAGEGEFLFDNSSSSMDGPAHQACLSNGETAIDHDVWFCWTSPCSGEVFIRTCERTEVDTWLAVYDLCACPATEERLLACNDDLCDLASMVRFEAVTGRTYSIRVGTFPGAAGGTGHFSITCGPPENPSCPGPGSCCLAEGGMGCQDKECCERVCACDPFCCLVAWDETCSGRGKTPGCGAAALCNCGEQCGSPTTGSCCDSHGAPFCNDAACCETVCSCDPYCCDTEWDEFCAATGSGNNCGAEILCGSLCAPDCPIGEVQFVNDNVVDARRPFHPEAPGIPLGITQIHAMGPPAADRRCWSLCETVGTGNQIVDVNEGGAGNYTLILARPLSPGGVTAISYRDNNSFVQTGHFISHPSNADGAGAAEPLDVVGLVNALMGTQALPWGILSRDIDFSGVITPMDVLDAIDLLNGAGPYAAWNGTLKPSSEPLCP